MKRLYLKQLERYIIKQRENSQEIQKRSKKKQITNSQQSTVFNSVDRQKMQVIELHPYENSYPFGMAKQTQLTYVQMTKQPQSSQQLQSYKHNLKIFKSIQSQLLIGLDSFVQQDNRLLIYYHYEPLSIKSFIEYKLNQYADQLTRDNFLNKVVTNINFSIDSLINLLTQNHIQAILAIDNIAISNNNQIKFFIQPDFDHLPNSSSHAIQQYYLTEKKKLQIQLEQSLEHIFSTTNHRPTQLKKANFIIQGNKLVFINDQQTNRQSSTNSILPFSQTLKNKQKNTTLNSQSSSQNNSKNSIKEHENSKHKFDIKNILDQKKLQKNQILTMLQNITKKQQKQQSNDKRQVRNYFENNDDFNKDASFYPEEFIKDDSIAEFQGYEDELQRQLEDLKRKKYEEEEQNNKNRVNMVPNSPTAVHFSQQKMMKFHGFSQAPTQTQPKQVNSLKYPSNYQRDLNTSSNHQNDTSTQQRQKRKYKVTITTSHQVDVEDGDNVNLKEIQKQLIEDIKKGRFKGNQTHYENGIPVQYSKTHFDKDQFVHYNSPSHVIKGRQTHNPSSSHEIYTNQTNFQQRNTSLNSIGSNMSSSVDQKINDDRTFTKHHYLVTQHGQHSQSGKQIKINPTEKPTHSNAHGHDIKKILQKIKTNMTNQQNQSHIPQSNQGNYGILTTNQIDKEHTQNVQMVYNKLKYKPSFSQQETQIHSVKDIQPGENKAPQIDKEYHDKILKAKMKAQQIMKLVKQRKGH